MKIIFMGTPDFAVPALEALIEAGHKITLAVTQPDKPKGRGKKSQFPPVKVCAVEHNIPVFQPNKIKEAESMSKLKEYEADIIVVAAFGQILPKELLIYPKYGCINIHASLLPKYRGAAPIQWAVIDGEEKSGVTIMQMAEGLDTGDIITQAEVLIDKQETGGTLHDKLSVEGAKLCVSTVKSIQDGTAERTPQNDAVSCYAKMLNKQLGNINWDSSAESIERLIRGLNPWPSAYTFYNGKMLKVWSAEIGKNVNGRKAGEVICRDGKIVVAANDKELVLNELQLEGKKRMRTEDFLRGFNIKDGDIFG